MQNENSLHVLLFEDDEWLASLTRTYLEGHGIIVTIVSDGIRDLREALRYRHDAVLTGSDRRSGIRIRSADSQRAV